MKVAYQGEPGAYSEHAILIYFGPVETTPCKSFGEAFDAVASGACDSALIPIENSLGGSVYENYDLLAKHELHIVGEFFLRVRHCLISFPGVSKSAIKKVISHPQALAQCAQYLRKLGAEVEAVYDTAGSVMMIKHAGERSTAAIASRHAAELYEMQILDEGIEDDARNVTRFLALERVPRTISSAGKTSMVMTLANRPDALAQVLNVLSAHQLNVTKIQSRPVPAQPWQYYFFLDVAGAAAGLELQSVLDELSHHTLSVRVLGSYARAAMPD